MNLKLFIKKWKLYFNNYEAYKNFKYELKLNKAKPILPKLDINPTNGIISFKHSGNIGDIIYALPTVFSLAKNADIHIYIGLDAKGSYGKNSHPLGNKSMNEQMVKMIKPLLLNQPQIKLCEIINSDTHIDYDLDLFRKYPFTTQAGNIARWYFYVFATNANLGNQWLHVIPNKNYENSIVIARSQRYNAVGINYNFLNQYSNLYFIGVEVEYLIMKKIIPQLTWIEVKDFLEMAQVIAGCKLFIGNQSFPFSLAEALKHKRILEVYQQCPNVIPEGDNGFDFCYQPQFEYLVKENLQ